MGRHKKHQFINKKEAVTFHLVHRSQRDPLQADEESSKFVLQETVNPNERKSKDERLQEQRKYGVFYEDDYDYTQHLREAQSENVSWSQAPKEADSQKDKVKFREDAAEDDTKAKIQLPADIFPSEKEDDIGLLNRAAPISGLRLDLDPDVVAAMDEDFDMDNPENILDDDFVLKAQDIAPAGGEESRLRDDGYDESEDELEGDDVSSGGEFEREEFDDDEEETKTRFTNYSLSSSVIRRNEGLTLLDDRFEKMVCQFEREEFDNGKETNTRFTKSSSSVIRRIQRLTLLDDQLRRIYEEYDDMDMGAIEHDDIEGFADENNEILNQALTEFEKSQQRLVLEKDEEALATIEGSVTADGDEDSDNEDDLIKMKYEERPKEAWDCESILSTYSNLYNHPKMIDDRPTKQKNKDENTGTIRLSQKTGMPLGVLPAPGPTRKQLERQELEEYRIPLDVKPRRKGQKEDSEEKRDRKQAVKAERKIRRMEKKANKDAFKEEEKTQKKILLNQKNTQGLRIT